MLAQELIQIYKEEKLLRKLENFFGFSFKKNFSYRKTTLTGSSEEYELKDLKEYGSGDNFQKINWKLFAKSGKLYVRDYTILERPKFVFLCDTSGSMNRKKKRLLELVYFLLGLFFSKRREVQLFFVFGKTIAKDLFELRIEKNFQEKILRLLGDLEFSDETNFLELIESSKSLIKKKKLKRASLILISDLIESSCSLNDSWLENLKSSSSSSKDNKLLIFQLFKKLDYQVPNLGKIEISNPERKNRKISLDLTDPRIREAYQKLALKRRVIFLEKIQRLSKKREIKLCEVNADLSFSSCFNFFD